MFARRQWLFGAAAAHSTAASASASIVDSMRSNSNSMESKPGGQPGLKYSMPLAP